MCGQKKKLEVHHIHPWEQEPHYRLDWNNLITLCRHCHLRFGHLGYWKDWNPNIVEYTNKMWHMVSCVLQKRGH